MRAWVLIALAPCWLIGCGDSDEPGDPPGADAGGAGGAGDGLDGCPDPNDPMVHYQTMNVAECPAEELSCTADQNGFHNACGCGCIDKGPLPCNLDPDTVDFISEDPAVCGDINPDCPFGQRPFNNSCGCGCADE